MPYKKCPDCQEPLVALRSMNKKLCSGCKKYWPFYLKPNQKPMHQHQR